jgi:hypothetical protein
LGQSSSVASTTVPREGRGGQGAGRQWNRGDSRRGAGRQSNHSATAHVADGFTTEAAGAIAAEFCLCNVIAKVDSLAGKCRAGSSVRRQRFYAGNRENGFNGGKRGEKPSTNGAKSVRNGHVARWASRTSLTLRVGVRVELQKSGPRVRSGLRGCSIHKYTIAFKRFFGPRGIFFRGDTGTRTRGFRGCRGRRKGGCGRMLRVECRMKNERTLGPFGRRPTCDILEWLDPAEIRPCSGRR